jgi:chemotaxis protein methyltransferase CheR
MNPGLSDDVLSRLSDFATAALGLRFPPDRWSELQRGVASAALELGIADIEGWVDALLAGGATAAHVKALANHLTIPETYFFRQRETFTLLGEKILPEVFARRRAQGRPVRIWSAACASGEEPYSVAILIRRIFPELAPGAVVIHGTDINSHVLARATRGVFSEWSFRDTPEWVKAASFTRKPNGRYEIARETGRMVKFSHLNLAEGLYPPEFGERGDFDLILCRNVLMYFSAEWQAKIIRRLVAALTAEGWLLVGPCDIAVPQAEELGLQSNGPGVFQRSDAPARGARPAPPEGIEARPLPPAWWLPPGGAEAAPAETGASEAPPPQPRAAGGESAAAPAVSGAPTAVTEGEVVSALAQAKADRGELEAARAACDEAIALDPINPSFHYLRACILQEMNRPAEAAESFRRVLFLDPESVMAHFALGCLAERGGDRPEARRQFSRVLRLLGARNRGDAVPGGDGLTVGRLRAVVEENLGDDAA